MMPFPKKPTLQMMTCGFLAGGAIGAAIATVQIKKEFSNSHALETSYDQAQAEVEVPEEAAVAPAPAEETK